MKYFTASCFNFPRASAKNDFMYSPSHDEFLKLAAREHGERKVEEKKFSFEFFALCCG